MKWQLEQLNRILQNTSGETARWTDDEIDLLRRIVNNLAGPLRAAWNDAEVGLLRKLCHNTAGETGSHSSLRDSELDLLYKIAGNTALSSGGLAPLRTDTMDDLLFKIAHNLGGADADMDVITARIDADGGVITDEPFLSDLITQLKSGGCYTILDGLWVPIAIKKDGGNLVSKIYDLSPAKPGSVFYDCVQPTGALQQLWQANQIDGKPWIMFNPAKGGYVASGVASIAQPVTAWVICRKDGGGDGPYYVLSNRATALTFTPAMLYYDHSNVGTYGGGNELLTATGITTIGQFTVLLNNIASTQRRKGAQISVGAVVVGDLPTGGYGIGSEVDGTSVPHSGPIAFCACVRQALPTIKRDYIEGLLNNMFYPSTVA